MSTITISASKLGFTTYSGSSWTNGRIQQGHWDQTLYVGMAIFPSLRTDTDWSGMIVSEIRINLTFGNSGGDYTKNIGFYTSTRSTLGGRGSESIGSSIGLITNNVIARNNTDTLVFNQSTNAASFSALVDWLQNGTTDALTIFNNDDPRSGYSRHYLSILAFSFEIDCEVAGSSGTITPNPVGVSESITLTVIPPATSRVLTHEVVWSCGSYSSGTITLASGVSETTFLIPDSWRGAITSGQTSADANCKLTTLSNGVTLGEKDIPFVITLPDRLAPVVHSFSVKRYSELIDDEGVTYYKEMLTGTHVWISMSLEIDTDDGQNIGSASLRYWPADDETDVTGPITIPWTGATVSLTNDRTIVDDPIAITDAYVFELTATNGHQTVKRQSRVEKAWAPFHVAGTGYGVGVGMYSDGTQLSPKFQVAWPGNFVGGIVGVTNYSTDETDTGGTWINGKPIYRKTISTNVTAGNTTNTDPIANMGIALFWDAVAVNTSGETELVTVYRPANANYLSVDSTITGTAYITVYYTKTTD